MRNEHEIERAFTYHAPRNEDEIAFYQAARERAKSFALWLFYWLPETPERTIALRHLEEAVFYANAGCARNGLAPVITNISGDVPRMPEGLV